MVSSTAKISERLVPKGSAYSKKDDTIEKRLLLVGAFLFGKERVDSD